MSGRRAGPSSPSPLPSPRLQGPACRRAERKAGAHRPPPVPAAPTPPALRSQGPSLCQLSGGGGPRGPASPQTQYHSHRVGGRSEATPRQAKDKAQGRLLPPPPARHTQLQVVPECDPHLHLGGLASAPPGLSWLLRLRTAGSVAQSTSSPESSRTPSPSSLPPSSLPPSLPPVLYPLPEGTVAAATPGTSLPPSLRDPPQPSALRSHLAWPETPSGVGGPLELPAVRDMRAALLLQLQARGTEPALGWHWASHTLSSAEAPACPHPPCLSLPWTCSVTPPRTAGVSGLTFRPWQMVQRSGSGFTLSRAAPRGAGVKRVGPRSTHA